MTRAADRQTVAMLCFAAGLDPPSGWQMRAMGSLAKEIKALETTEKVIATLALSSERDALIDRLIAAIEQDRAELLASMISGDALHREPPRLRKRIADH